MPRKARFLFDGGIYHVYSRGNNRKNLFLAPEDFEVFLEQLKLLKPTFGYELFHYCLMTNHFHLLIRMTKGEELSKLMHRLKLSYTRYYKTKYDFVGHLFQGRYKSPWIEEESYYLQCGRYIERNPVSAGMVKECHHYPYSSASYYVEGKVDELLTENIYYKDMGKTAAERRLAYREFVSLEEPYKVMVDAALEKV